MRPRLGIVVLALVLPSGLLAFHPGGHLPFGPAKWTAVAVLAPAGAALTLSREPLRVPTGGNDLYLSDLSASGERLYAGGTGLVSAQTTSVAR